MPVGSQTKHSPHKNVHKRLLVHTEADAAIGSKHVPFLRLLLPLLLLLLLLLLLEAARSVCGLKVGG